MIPIILGFPLWRGKIKNRVAKKILTRWRQGWMLHSKMSNLGIGDFVNTCTGYNSRIGKLTPEYFTINSNGGQILGDITIESDKCGHCSLSNCGVEPKLSQEEIEKRKVEFLREYTLGELGEIWFGKGSQKHLDAIARANHIISLIESGEHITDQDGVVLPEFQ
jgi:hypothetical protein